MRIRIAVPDKHVTAGMIDAALEAVTRANDVMLASGERPTTEELIAAGAKWKPEQYGDGEHFDLASTIGERGWGDCDDWAPTFASDLRVSGFPNAYAHVKATGPKRWHAVVNDGDGREYDPSVMAGMKSRSNPTGVKAAVHGRMVPAGVGGIVLMPHPDNRRWAARVDTPWGADHLSAIGYDEDPREAIWRALRGSLVTGEGIGLDMGRTHEVGFGLGDLVSSALPIAAGVIPGGGAALGLANGLLGALGGGGGGAAPAPAAGGQGLPQGMVQAAMPGNGLSPPGTIAWNPHSPGPVIVRF